MIKLNLPEFEYNIKQAEGKVWIFDMIRKKYVVLTPEEWVRQHWLNFLVVHKGYPKSLIKVETGLTYNRLSKRSDVVVFDRTGKEWMVIECKSPKENLNESTVRQASVYNKTLKAPYITISNGMESICFFIDHEKGETRLLKDLPDYDQ